MYVSVVYRLGQSMFIITILLYGHFVDTVTQEEFLHTCTFSKYMLLGYINVVHTHTDTHTHTVAANKKLTFRSVSTIV